MNDKVVGRTKLGEPQVNIGLLGAVLKELNYILCTFPLLIKLTLCYMVLIYYVCRMVLLKPFRWQTAISTFLDSSTRPVGRTMVGHVLEDPAIS
jgi:hypothetical protein